MPIEPLFAIGECGRVVPHDHRLSGEGVPRLGRLTPRDRERIVAKIMQCAADPLHSPDRLKPLTGSECQRLTIGSHRAIYAVARRHVQFRVLWC